MRTRLSEWWATHEANPKTWSVKQWEDELTFSRYVYLFSLGLVFGATITRPEGIGLLLLFLFLSVIMEVDGRRSIKKSRLATTEKEVIG